MIYYDEKLVFVTGGSEGIGLAIAKNFVRARAHVVILSRSQKKLDAALRELEKVRWASHQLIEAWPLDVADDEAAERELHKLAKKRGAPDYLINCAGFALPGYLVDLSLKDYRSMMDVNYFGIVNVCKALVPKILSENKKTHIVNTSSLAGFIGLFGYTGYCGSKYAVVGFSQALAAELKPQGVLVSVLCPPNTRTPGLEKENLTKPAEVLRVEEKAKVLDPDEISRFLLKNLSKNKFWIIPTLDGNLAHYLSRFAPKILNQFVKRPY